MNELLQVSELIAYGASQYGYSRNYVVRFGASSPIILCTEPDGTAVAELWFKNGAIQENVFRTFESFAASV